MKSTGRTLSMTAGLALGGVVSLVVTLAGVGLLTCLIDRQHLDMANVGYGILILLLLGSFLGAKVAHQSIRRRRMLVCLCAGGVYLGELLAITALFFGGQYSGVGTTALLILAGSGAAALLGMEQGRGGGRRKIKVPLR